MYVVLNVLDVTPDKKDAVAEKFILSSEKMKQIPGCVEFQFLSSPTEGKQVVYTKWESEQDYQRWKNSEEFQTDHERRHRVGITASKSNIETYNVVYEGRYRH
ncbi:antibiotic biosynthesis monooxygenase [Alicyclobacillus tolerans]|uniref:antibiotic biosynthesis monooxygenase family protein n=1 Tax=Alicyclobacillus tolerans TaxID=90970 RepID=UPI001F34B8A1|nr:antibiotic biosynthesis monooxygenase family protein [Alicyclobacillus tolerans]MCF8563377.1 antibiotic biosynthesis monooxygenase [Alicyclobacillus tolerans]